jgi:alpha-ketoglutarate-dependent taurine dioxygenase
MNGTTSGPPGFDRFRAGARQPITLSTAELVKSSRLPGGGELPLVVEPMVEGVDAARWATVNREQVEGWLLRHGAILFRGFGVTTAERFEQLACAISPDLLDYRERSSPRSEIKRGIYTSTDHPADQYIHFHNEQSYTHSWPLKLWFFCLQAADEGGATPLADGRRVLKALNPQLKERFLKKKVLYVRNYIEGIGLTWQDAFQTTDRAVVEEYCRRASIAFAWGEGGRLTTRQVFDAILTHPKTGEPLWFEHAAFFHVSSLEPDVRETLLREYGPANLPFNTYYGDGSPIEDSVLDELRGAYRQAAVSFRWQEGDVLLIDNMLTSHGREPFKGPRKILVAMAELYFKKS